MNKIMQTSVTRRQFIVASASAAGGLMISVSFRALGGRFRRSWRKPGARTLRPTKSTHFLPSIPTAPFLFALRIKRWGRARLLRCR